jgi:predicted HTH transcriptional regulator
VEATIAELIAGGETEGVEFKATLRTNLHTGQHDDKMHMAVLKTIAAFLNAGGGTLLIGVADDGVVTGLTADGFANEDKMSLHLVNLLRDRVGELFLPYIHPEFIEHDGSRVLSVRCERGPKPAFVKEGAAQRRLPGSYDCRSACEFRQQPLAGGSCARRRPVPWASRAAWTRCGRAPYGRDILCNRR